MLRVLAIWLAGALAFSALACRGPVKVDEASQRSAHSVLAPFQTRAQLESFFGHAPTRCLPSNVGRELCSWQLSGRDPAWPQLARTLMTRDRIAVVCEVPNNERPRDWDSCTVHPKRSSRNSWRAHTGVGASLPARRRHAAEREHLRDDARERLASAKTLVAMSRLMGQLPERCQPVEPVGEVCDWLATNHTYGHGILAASIPVPLNKKVKLTCTYPGGACSAVMP